MANAKQEFELIAFLNRFEKTKEDGSVIRGFIGDDDENLYIVNVIDKGGKEYVTLKKNPLSAEQKLKNAEYRAKRAAKAGADVPSGETLSV